MFWPIYPCRDVSVNSCFSYPQSGLLWNLLSLLDIILCQEIGIYIAIFSGCIVFYYTAIKYLTSSLMMDI